MSEKMRAEEAAEEYADKESIHSYEHNDWPEIYKAFLAGDANGYARGKAEERERIWEALQEGGAGISTIKQIIFGGGNE